MEKEFRKPLPKTDIEELEEVEKKPVKDTVRYTRTDLIESTVPGILDNETNKPMTVNEALLEILNKVDRLERSLL